MFEVKPLTGHIGAELSGIALREPIAAELAACLREALDKWRVIFIRDQFLGIEQQKRLTHAFGPIMRLPYVEAMKDDPDVIAVLKEADETNGGVFGGDWHSDFSFLEQPPAGSVLNAVEIPATGGDTLWADQAIAYETLSTELKTIVDEHDAIHVGKPYGVKHAPSEETRSGSSIKMTRDDPEADKETRHPAVYTNPGTGQRSLNLNPIYTTRFSGMTESESAPLLKTIYKHCTKPDFCCRFRWSAGTVVVWDNRMTLHYAVNDYDGYRRLLYRTAFGQP